MSLPATCGAFSGISDNSIKESDPDGLAGALEELLYDSSEASTHNQPTDDETDLMSEMGDHSQADTVEESTPAPAIEVEPFSFGRPGAPIPGRAQEPSQYESQAAFMDSAWAPFRSQLEWDMARWVKLRGGTSTAVTEMLAIPGVCASKFLYSTVPSL